MACKGRLSSVPLLVAIVFYCAFCIVLIALAANMFPYCYSANDVCLAGPNPTNCGLLWLFMPACAVAVTAGCVGVAGSLVAIFWLTLEITTEWLVKIIRIVVVFSQVAPIIFAGISGILFALVSKSIFDYNGSPLVAPLSYANQTAAASAISFSIFLFGFILCSFSANHDLNQPYYRN